MQEFIQMVTQKLGVSPDAARSAAGGLLKLIQDKAGDSDFQKLAQEVPGAREVMAEAPEPAEASGGGGMLGGLMNKAANMVGGDAGAALGLAGIFSKSGIDTDKIGSFVSMFVNFVKEKAGGDVINKVLGQVPDLAKFVK